MKGYSNWTGEDRHHIHKDYHQEILFLCKKYNVKPSQVEIDPYHCTGEICIFIKGKWYGYIDNEFYKMVQGEDNYWQ